MSAPTVHPFPVSSREQVQAALEAAVDSGHLPEGYEGFLSDQFEPAIGQVSQALRDAGLYGDFDVYAILAHEPDTRGTDGGYVLVRLPSGPVIASRPVDLKHFTSDRIATGIDGLVAIADVILNEASNTVMTTSYWLEGAR